MTFESDNGHDNSAFDGRPAGRTDDGGEPRSEVSRTTSEYLQRLEARIQDFHAKLAAFDAAERLNPLPDSVPVRPPLTGFSGPAAAAAAAADARSPGGPGPADISARGPLPGSDPLPASGESPTVSSLRRTPPTGVVRSFGAPPPDAEREHGARGAPGHDPAAAGNRDFGVNRGLGLSRGNEPDSGSDRGLLNQSPRDSQRRAEDAVTDARHHAADIRRRAAAEAETIRSAAEATATDLRSLAQRDAAALRAQAAEDARLTAERGEEERLRADQDMRHMWQALEHDAAAIQDEISRRVDRLAQTMEDVRHEAARVRAEATAETDRVRSEAVTTADRVLAEAEAESRRLINAAQSAATTVRESAIAAVREAADREAREARQHLARQIREAAIVAIKLVDRSAPDTLGALDLPGVGDSLTGAD
jgi:hypothetical protein